MHNEDTTIFLRTALATVINRWMYMHNGNGNKDADSVVLRTDYNSLLDFPDTDASYFSFSVRFRFIRNPRRRIFTTAVKRTAVRHTSQEVTL